MIINSVLLSIYGLLTLLSALLTFAWGRVSFRRLLLDKTLRIVLKDRYIMLALGLTLHSLGTMVLFGTRSIALLKVPAIIQILPQDFRHLLVLGTALMLFAKYSFMWAINMNTENKWWHIALATTVLWPVFSFWWIYSSL